MEATRLTAKTKVSNCIYKTSAHTWGLFSVTSGFSALDWILSSWLQTPGKTWSPWVPTWPLFFGVMLVYLSCFCMLWTINNARECFPGYENTVVSATPPSNAQTAVTCVCTGDGFLVGLSPLFTGCRESSSTDNTALCFYIFRNTPGLKAKLLINVNLEVKPPSSHLQMPWEASFSCAMKANRNS